ncbi:hypothetical protein A3F32_02585 [Candidatus Roizmanbacteria bacterium RIFCSPHIGHO2_12_FULL_42_10]|uniref:Uncharacterized protein n=1 Tax=Candidatus Roizmanbacteria bacterium RIFCSPHIGHO2_12_FULL_42_10 TaxID=1802053 RepID=A0A1F7I4G6_9BACT|nr:MAG: hypothetical protein A3F32_02585 [Candidatus Roizmanbacteria bacterium RIFCSPHIGHO2_12_FULL_42_10]
MLLGSQTRPAGSVPRSECCQGAEPDRPGGVRRLTAERLVGLAQRGAVGALGVGLAGPVAVTVERLRRSRGSRPGGHGYLVQRRVPAVGVLLLAAAALNDFRAIAIRVERLVGALQDGEPHPGAGSALAGIAPRQGSLGQITALACCKDTTHDRVSFCLVYASCG